MTTDQITPVVRRWLRHTEATPPDARQSARQVMARMPYVRQRRRWLPLPTFRRKSPSAPSTSDREHRFAVIPDTTDRFPIDTGRTRLMFSPVKAIIGGALVFALSAAFLVAQPLEQQGTAPGAATDAVDPGPAAYVHGTMFEGDCCGDEVETYDDDGNRLTLRGSVMSGNLKMDDPRISGAWATTFNIDEYARPDTDERVEVHWGELTITNDQGDWRGTWKSTYDSSSPVETDLLLYELAGAGAYEGLSALLAPLAPTETDVDWGRWPLAGAIFPGPLPPDSAYDE